MFLSSSFFKTFYLQKNYFSTLKLIAYSIENFRKQNQRIGMENVKLLPELNKAFNQSMICLSHHQRQSKLFDESAYEQIHNKWPRIIVVYIRISEDACFMTVHCTKLAYTNTTRTALRRSSLISIARIYSRHLLKI